MIIAVDGPAAAGKGTLARRLAKHFGFAFLDTGLLYRAVGWKLLNSSIDPEDVAAATRAAESLRAEDLEGPTLRDDNVSVAASMVAPIEGVRAALLDFQQDFAKNPPQARPGAVLDGRDIGTVVCPDAETKIYITASLEVRAERRVKELRERGLDVIYSRVLQDMEERDKRDSNRNIAPLVPAEDAFVLDTGALDAEEVFAAALNYIKSQNISGFNQAT